VHVFFDIPPNVDDDNENPARPRDNRRRLKIGKNLPNNPFYICSPILRPIPPLRTCPR